MRVLIIDNYDSFVYNISQQVGQLTPDVTVVRNDAIDVDGVERFDPDAVILSPGPGHPSNQRDFGVCRSLLCSVSRTIPTLGVCLGHQGIADAYGWKVSRAARVMHGKTSAIYHDGSALYDGIENPFIAGRYHSLIVEPGIPTDLVITARTATGEIMGLRHRRYPIIGVQFHPESALTPCGRRLMRNFLGACRR
jgi:anthranilate synthase/aminodeoxychorismate synthase-like glutamine amidotransferase